MVTTAIRCNILLIGSTGMLGQAIRDEAIKRELSIIGVARKGAEINLDISNEEAVKTLFEKVTPEVVINCAANINLNFCEDNYEESYKINTLAVEYLTEQCKKNKTYFVQISTDHYYANDKDKKHDEKHNIDLFNNYARTKYQGEKHAARYDNSLIVRTNILGFAHKKDSKTFVEWLLNLLINKENIPAIDDYYTSSIDVKTFSKILFDVINLRTTGIYNIASSDVFSKEKFIRMFAKKLNIYDAKISSISIKSLVGVERADSLGLDVTKIENLLKYKMPTLDEVVHNLIEEYRGMTK